MLEQVTRDGAFQRRPGAINIKVGEEREPDGPHPDGSQAYPGHQGSAEERSEKEAEMTQTTGLPRKGLIAHFKALLALEEFELHGINPGEEGNSTASQDIGGKEQGELARAYIE